jgi:SH3/ankyrin repeat-containing protein
MILTAKYPALQYLDDVDEGGVADLAGLRRGDFLIQVRLYKIKV